MNRMKAESQFLFSQVGIVRGLLPGSRRENRCGGCSFASLALDRPAAAVSAGRAARARLALPASIMRRVPTAPGGKTPTPACNRGSPASTSGRTAAAWYRPCRFSLLSPSRPHCGSASSLALSCGHTCCGAERHWDDPGMPWQPRSSPVQRTGFPRQPRGSATNAGWARQSKCRHVVACGLSSTLAAVHSWGGSLTEALARSLVRRSLAHLAAVLCHQSPRARVAAYSIELSQALLNL